MTAVLLTILKIIGIVLLVILGIMLFLLAVLLFVPVRYSVKGTVDNNITAEGKHKALRSTSLLVRKYLQ